MDEEQKNTSRLPRLIADRNLTQRIRFHFVQMPGETEWLYVTSMDDALHLIQKSGHQEFEMLTDRYRTFVVLLGDS